jgi:hypothetical protein
MVGKTHRDAQRRVNPEQEFKVSRWKIVESADHYRFVLPGKPTVVYDTSTEGRVPYLDLFPVHLEAERRRMQQTILQDLTNEADDSTSAKAKAKEGDDDVEMIDVIDVDRLPEYLLKPPTPRVPVQVDFRQVDFSDDSEAEGKDYEDYEDTSRADSRAAFDEPSLAFDQVDKRSKAAGRVVLKPRPAYTQSIGHDRKKPSSGVLRRLRSRTPNDSSSSDENANKPSPTQQSMHHGSVAGEDAASSVEQRDGDEDPGEFSSLPR